MKQKRKINQNEINKMSKMCLWSCVWWSLCWYLVDYNFFLQMRQHLLHWWSSLTLSLKLEFGNFACLTVLVFSVLSSASLDGFLVLLIKLRLPDVIDYLYVGREDYKTDGWPLKQNLMTYNDEAMKKCFTSDWVKINTMIMPMIPSLTKPPPDPYSVLSFLLGGQKERQPDNNLRGACVLWFSEVNAL